MTRILVYANESQREEWSQRPAPTGTVVAFVKTVEELYNGDADVYFHLDFDETESAVIHTGKPCFVNAVVNTLQKFPPNVIRINAWTGFLKGTPIEMVCSAHNNGLVRETMEALNWKYQLVPDIVGMIAPRTVAMIINEAYYALGEQVSTAREIDTAMKLGTNYPFGPFEWAKKIGLQKMHHLLTELGKTNSRYTIAPGLKVALQDEQP